YIFDRITTLESEMDMGNTNDVGQRIKEARKNAGFSQRELAHKSNISVNTLSLLERGQTSPTIATLQKLADSLSVEISRFFTAFKPEDEIVFSKSNRRIPIQISEGLLTDLSPGFTPDVVRSFELQVFPRSKSKKAVSHSGFEFLYCLENELICVVSERAYLLEQGDTLLFDANLPHQWQNSSDKVTKIIMIQIKTSEEDETCDLVDQTNSLKEP
ncbi:MAG: helix-turn-helix domain-containing protein, partial [Anaerolineaceae bacterium]|nr:helix-turn-helix domain-containing protein [Anaerolineaceae bacterium]